MRINKAINDIIDYGLINEMIMEEDIDYAINKLLMLFNLNDFERKFSKNNLDIETILDEFIKYAIENEQIENSFSAKDILVNKIVDCIMPRPSEVINRFNQKANVSMKQATDYYYHLVKKANYVKKDQDNIKFEGKFKNNNLKITINLAKPEKDPKDIAAMKKMPASNYPKCLLCKENVGFKGDAKRASRITHRIIPLNLAGKKYYLQYSPYAYYNEHCIIFNHEHQPMCISEQTFKNLIAFVDKFPHYFIGSNADLPIVGGSILTHDHYQGGDYIFPIEKAKIIKNYRINQQSNILVQLIDWPLSTIRLISDDKDTITEVANQILTSWQKYDDVDNDILCFSNGEQHNTITPILRKINNQYYLYIVLRNNRVNDRYPDGIFHPHKQWHHIKKENIGLIEVMGLAILPARLKKELQAIKDYLLNQTFDESIDKHMDWIKQMQQRYTIKVDNIDQILQDEVVDIFGHVLEDCGVFKQDDDGIKGFDKFIKIIGGVEDESK